MNSYVRVELPGGLVRVLKEPTYRNIVISMQQFAKAIENAEYVSGPNGELEANLKSGPFWKHVLTTVGR